MPRCQSISCGERQGVAAAGGGARSRRGGGGGRMAECQQQRSRWRRQRMPAGSVPPPRLLPGHTGLAHPCCSAFGCDTPVGLIYSINPAMIVLLVPVVGAMTTDLPHFDMIHYGRWPGQGGGGGHCCSGVPAGGGGDVSRMQHARFCCSPSARAPWAPQSTTCSRLTATAAPPSTTRRLSSHPPCCAGGWVSALSPFLIVAFNTGACVGVHRGGCFSVGTQEVCTGPIAVLAVVDASLSECRGPPTALCVLGDPLLACGLACPMTGCHHAPS